MQILLAARKQTAWHHVASDGLPNGTVRFRARPLHVFHAFCLCSAPDGLPYGTVRTRHFPSFRVSEVQPEAPSLAVAGFWGIIVG